MKFMQNHPERMGPARRLWRLGDPAILGFTLPEVLVSVIILVIATLGSIAGFNLITQSVRGTGARVEQNRIIDQDIASINTITEEFTSCEEPSGEAPGNPVGFCSDPYLVGVEFENSYYYFPPVDGTDPTTFAEAEAFATACRDGSLIDNFIDAVGSDGSLAADVERQLPQLVAGTNSLVEVAWTDPTRGDRLLRSIRVVPFVANWCP